MCNFLLRKLYILHNMSNTLTAHTTAKLIGLAACGASALGLSLDAALLTRSEDLLAALTAAGLLPQPQHGITPAATPPPAAVAEEDPAVLTALGIPATPAAQPELALGYEPTPPPAGAHGILARAAKLNQNRNPKS